MSHDPATRRRFARQLLLGEVGEAGVERLLESDFRQEARSDATAYRVAADYLQRAGCVPDPAGDPVGLPEREVVLRFAGSTDLFEPAAAIVGAFCATEHLKAVLGIAEPSAFPHELRLVPEQ